MNEVKTLKVALVAVILASASFIGYSTYVHQKQDDSVKQFVESISEAQNEDQAAKTVGVFISQNKQLIASKSANAGLWGWLKKKLGGGRGSSVTVDDIINDTSNSIIDQAVGDDPAAH